MNDPTAPPTVTPASAPAKRRGCFFYGCITVLVIMVLCGIAGFFAIRYGLNKFTAFVEQYTDTTPMKLPTVQMSSTDYQLLDKRVTAFSDAVNARKATLPLVLTGDEINALIANSPAWKALKGKLYVAIEGDQVMGTVSIPMDDLAEAPGLSRLKGRYLNGSAALKVSLTNSVLVVTLQSLEAKGQRPPPQIMTQLQSVNFAQNSAQDPKTQEMIGRLESIEVKDGKITIKVRAKE
jgi:hypothetical protein